MDKTIEEFLARIEHTTGRAPRPTIDGWQANCPAHDDRRASLTLRRGEAGRILVKCHAGCHTEAVVAAIGWKITDLSPTELRPISHNLPSRRANEGSPRRTFSTYAHAWSALTKHWGEPAVHWEYCSAGGDLVGLVLRWDLPGGKEIRPISRVDGHWVIGAMKAPRPLYRLPAILEGTNAETLDSLPPVFVVEGEKAAAAGAAVGLVTTTSAGGAGAAEYSDWSPLAGRDVVLLPDNDEAGRKYVRQVLGQLLQLSTLPKVRAVALPDLPPGGDLADFVEARETMSADDVRRQILALCEATTPIAAASALDAPAESAAEMGGCRRGAAEHPVDSNSCSTSLGARGARPQPPGSIPPGTSTASVPAPSPLAPVLTRLSECQPTTVEWLWPGRIPQGKLTLLVGDPGLGKSFLTLDLAARITTGRPLPVLAGETAICDNLGKAKPGTTTLPGSVVLLSAEDDASDTICPRFLAAGGDPTRIAILHAVAYRDASNGLTRETTFSLGSDMDVLEGVIRTLGDCRLVVIDPITAYLGSVDSHNNAEVRSLLAPLSALASRTGVAVLAINHLNKNTQGSALHRSMGSIAFAATARSALAVFGDPYDNAARLLISLKSNLAKPADGLRYRAIARGDDEQQPVLEWDSQPVRLTADEVLGAAAQSAAAGGATTEAADWLTEMLRSGPQAAVDLKNLAKADGIHERTLMRAKARLGLVCCRQGVGLAGNWVWQWPANRPFPPAAA